MYTVRNLRGLKKHVFINKSKVIMQFCDGAGENSLFGWRRCRLRSRGGVTNRRHLLTCKSSRYSDPRLQKGSHMHVMDLDNDITWLFLNIFQILKLIHMTQFLSANKKITGKTATFVNVSIVSLTCETPTCDKRDAAPCCAKAFCKWKSQSYDSSS